MSSSLEQAIAAPVEACDDCDDPPADGEEKKGGGAAVGTSSTAVTTSALETAKEKACEASKKTVTPAPCPNPDKCEADRVEYECTYSDEECPVVSTFDDAPDEWVEACEDSQEPAAWKAANCNLMAGPANKSHFAICTAKAVATGTTICVPKKACDAVFEPVQAEGAIDAED